MDPNTLLARIRQLTAAVNTSSASLSDITELGMSIADLDEWLSKGGFFPAAWSWNATTAA